MPMMTSKTEMLSLSSSKKSTVLKLSPTLSTQKMLLTFCFSHQQNILSLKNAKRYFALLSSHLLYSYPSQHLSLLGSFPFSTEIPFISMGTTPLIPSLKLTRPAHSFSFQLVSPPRIHMDSWWAERNPKQGLKWTHDIT